MQFVNSHAYALLGFSAAAGQFLFFNPHNNPLDPFGTAFSAPWTGVLQSMDSRSEATGVELPTGAEAFSKVACASAQVDGVIARAIRETPGDATQETPSPTVSATVPVSFKEPTNGGTSHGLRDTCFSKLDEIEFDEPIDAELLDVPAPAVLS